MTAPRPTGKTYTPPEGLRLVFIAMIGLWLLFPFLVRQNMAQDAIPYVVAGDLVHDHPEAVYPSKSGDLYDLDPAFASRACAVAPAGSDCSLNVAFVSTPLAIPVAVAVAALGGDGGVLAMRLVGAAALSAAMWILWCRLAHRTARAPQLLVATAVLLTPFAMAPIALGQTSELLVLSAVLGTSAAAGNSGRGVASHGSSLARTQDEGPLGPCGEDEDAASGGAGRHTRAYVSCWGTHSTRRVREALASGLWVATVALKAFPAVLVVLLVWQRRWRMLGWAAAWTAALGALALLAGPTSLWSDFVKGSGRLAGQSNWNAYNGSLDAIVHNLVPAVTDNGSSAAVLTLARAALGGALFWWGARRADHDTQWAVAFLVLLFVVPFVWWHYLWVAVGAVGVALAGRRSLDDRTLAVLPALALVTVPFSILNAQGQPTPVLQGLFLLAVAALAAALARGVDLPSGRRAPRAARI